MSKIEELSCFPRLLELDLYDNGIEAIENLQKCRNLLYFSTSSFTHFAYRILDLSYNRIEKIQGLSTLESLETLYLASNRIKAIDDLNTLKQLRVLELGANNISVSLTFLLFDYSGVENRGFNLQCFTRTTLFKP